MPITNADIAALPTLTAAELLKLCEYNIAKIHAGGQVRGMNGRQLTEADLADLYEQRQRLKDEVAAELAGADGLGNVLVRINPES